MTGLRLLRAAALFGALAVALGAFAAHGLRHRLAAEQLATFETGVRYHMYHALALLACAAMGARGARGTGPAGALFAAGIVLFSGSLYLLATRELTGLSSWRWLGPVTPVGGLCFIAGWIALLLPARQRDPSGPMRRPPL